ncbi:Fe-S cluster assembly protein SufD [Candidatus Sulfidibacterium hydrothermale]|uniref:Fe-S cluster assembly protein SufD n=1 Tax=Candidatus Sulfidibacterium hydrothermale TaxID=2875962 RepID=UPI001F0A9FF0|nr:Fe-S cluster assembly protein SufD [Candidatus Sulfidibacterium hydrothermale]UBM62119.1 Fe-S cluster assembly protein SufD [Candidatus Sulfidibacterium hydrothermale]
MMKKEKTKFPLEEKIVRHLSERLKDSGAHALAENKLHQEALAAFQQSGFPHNRMERWRHTDLKTALETDWHLFDRPVPYEKELSQIFLCEVHGFESRVISVLNGSFYAPEEEKITRDKNGVIVASLSAALREFPELVKEHWGKIMPQTDGFKSLNLAAAPDGVFIYVPDGVEVDTTFQVIHILNKPGLMINVRNLIVLGKNAKLRLLHCDDSVNHHAGFINKVNEVFLGEKAELELYKLQNLNNETVLLNQTALHQEASSRLKINAFSLNGGLIRNEIHDFMNGSGAWSDIRGLYLMDQKQHIDNQVNVYHNVPNCDSNQLFKGILDNEATGVFNGYIYVKRDAQQSNAFQKNANILLTKTARIDTMPHLEIYADDVQCSHGASVGQLDNEALFYLMQRGIPFADARMLLMYAFADAVIKEISIDALRVSIEDMVKRRLRGDLSICDRCVLHCSNPDQPVIFDIDISKI